MIQRVTSCWRVRTYEVYNEETFAQEKMFPHNTHTDAVKYEES